MKHKSWFFSIFQVLLAVLIWAALPVESSAQQPRKRVAVVLSGGGAKGMAHIGALKVIEKAGIPVDIIAGTSMGAIVGGLYAIGYDAATIDSMVHVLDWNFLLTDKPEMRSAFIDNRKKQNTYIITRQLMMNGREVKNRKGGFVEGRNLNRLFELLTRQYSDSVSFDSLPIPYACVATNLVDNTEYVFHSGCLAEAMRASMSIPGVFAPVRKDSLVLVDGGLRNNFPVDVARQMGADIVIGITVQDAPRTAAELNSGSAVLMQLIDINTKNKYDANVAATDVCIKVDGRGYSAASFTSQAIDTLIRRGQKAASDDIAQLIALKRKIGIADGYVPTRPARPVPPSLSDTAIVVRPDISLLRANLGVRFDTEDIVALQINGTYMPKRSPLVAEATLRLGKRIMARADVAFRPLDYGGMRLSYIFNHDDVNFYRQGSRDINMTYNRHTVEFAPFNFRIKNFDCSLSARWSNCSFIDILASRPVVADDTDKESHIAYSADISYDSEDKWYFPTRGARFSARYSYLTDNFVGYDGHAGINEIAASWRMSFALNSHLTLQPLAYGRLLFGEDVPLMERNVVGGSVFGHYLRQQMPLAGVGYAEFTDNQFVALQLQLSQRIATNNYIRLNISTFAKGDKLKSLVQNNLGAGCSAAYYYDSIFGPLGASLGWSTLTHNVCFYINLGFYF